MAGALTTDSGPGGVAKLIVNKGPLSWRQLGGCRAWCEGHSCLVRMSAYQLRAQPLLSPTITTL